MKAAPAAMARRRGPPSFRRWEELLDQGQLKGKLQELVLQIAGMARADAVALFAQLPDRQMALARAGLSQVQLKKRLSARYPIHRASERQAILGAGGDRVPPPLGRTTSVLGYADMSGVYFQAMAGKDGGPIAMGLELYYRKNARPGGLSRIQLVNWREQVRHVIDEFLGRMLLMREKQKLDILNNLNRAVASSLDLEKLFDTIRRQLMQIVKPQNMLLALADPGRSRFNVVFEYEGGRRRKPAEFPMGPGLGTLIWRTKRPILARDYLTECRRRGIRPAGKPAKAWLGVPLMAGRDCLGVLLMWDYRSHDTLSPETLDLVESVAHQAARAIENARIFRDSQQQLAETAALNRISQAISRVMELDKLWPLLHVQIKQILDASNFYIALYDPEAKELHFKYQVESGKLMPPGRRKLSGGLTEYVLRTRKPLLIQTPDKLERARALKKINLHGKPSSSWLGVPIETRGRLLGVMAVQSYTRAMAYTGRHQELMLSVASQAATAIENARLFQAAQRQVREINALFQVGQEVVKGQSLESLMGRLLEIIKEGFGYLNCAMLLADEAGRTLEVKSASGYTTEVVGTRLSIGKEGITGWAADLKQTVYVPDVQQENRYLQGSTSCRSEVALPLLSAGSLLGVLDVQKEQVDGFAAEEIAMLEGFANQAALAVDRIRGASIVQEKIRELSILFDISQSFTVSSDLASLLSALSGKLADGLGAGKCFIGIRLPAGDEMEIGVPEHVAKELESGPLEAEKLRQRTFRFKLDHGGAASVVFQSGKPLLSNRAKSDRAASRQFLEFFGISKLMVLPLVSRSKTIGLAYVADRRDGGDFGQHDLDLAGALAGQAALVVDNAMLYRDASLGLKQLATLYQMSQAITSSMTVEEIVRLGVEMASEVVPAEIVSLMLVDRSSGVLEIKAAKGLSEDTIRNLRLGPGQGLAGWAAEHQEAVVTGNLQQDPRFARVEQKEGIGPAMAIPLIAKDRVLGVLNVDNRSGHKEAFNQEQLQLLSTLAGSISLALERAVLLADLDGRISAQKALLETGNMMLGTLEVREVLGRISTAIERLIPFNGLAIYRADWDNRMLRPMVARGPFEKQIMADPPFPLDTGITGSIAISGRPEIINDSSKDGRAVHIEGTGEDSESVLAVPLVVQSRAEAVLTLWREARRPFTAAELELATLFTNQAVVAWNNARLFEEISAREGELADTNSRLNLALKRQIEVNTELSTLQYLSSTILSSLKLEEILSVVVEGIRTSLGFESVVMSLVDDSGQHLLHKAASGVGQADFEKMQQARTGLEEYLPMMRPEFRISNSYFLTRGGEGDWSGLESAEPSRPADDRQWRPGDRMLIPLYSKEKKLLAIVQIDRPANGLIPDKKKVRSLEAFGNTAVLAIENARLYHQAQSRIDELSTLYDIGLVISSAIEREKLLEKVVAVIREKLHYLKVAVFLVEPQSQSLLIGGQSGYGDELRNLYFSVGGDSVVGCVADQGQPLMIGDVSRDNRYNQADPRVRSEIAVPIKREGKTIGVLNIEDEKLNAFGESDLRLLTTLASQVSVALDNARLYEEARSRIIELKTLHEVGSTVSSTLKLETLLSQVCLILEETFKYYKIAILLVNPQTDELELMASHGYGDKRDNLGRRLRIGRDGITGMVAGSGEAVVIDDVTKHPRYICIDPKTRSEIAVPLTFNNRVIGVLNVESDVPSAFDRVDQRLLTTLANQVAVAVENARLYEETEQLAVTDGLTEVFNHRYFQGFLDRELSRARRYNRPLSLIMIDLDRFKDINDTHGHQAGDLVLQRVAVAVKSQARDVDLVARYGGEEFMVVLPETGKREAHALAERIRQAVREQSYTLPDETPPPRVTISLGVASYPEDGSEKSELVDRVDKALYRSKTEGRDRVSV
jgi:diguanylate cyclase (GGDEF)-like protein